jgi:hypothetical protein
MIFLNRRQEIIIINFPIDLRYTVRIRHCRIKSDVSEEMFPVVQDLLVLKESENLCLKGIVQPFELGGVTRLI